MRTIRDTKLDTRTARVKLASGKRYWRDLGAGLHLGYRRNASPVGSWLMRRYAGAQRYTFETLGHADDVAHADGAVTLSFHQAQEKAHRLHGERSRVDAGFPAQANAPLTVADAIRAYCDSLDRAGRKSAKDARSRAESMIVASSLGATRLDRLSKSEIEAWMNGLATQAPKVRGKRGGKLRQKVVDLKAPEVIRARRATANRTFNILRAALNAAWRDGKVASDGAWARIEPFREANAARIRFLDIDELRRLVNAAEPDFRALLRGAIYTGMRYGELASLEVRDFQRAVGKLHVRIAKSGKGRFVPLSDEAVAFFEEQTVGKPGDAPIFVRTDGSKWSRSSQWHPMRDACAKAGIVPAPSFHVLRHAFAALSVQAGASLQIVAKALGHSSSRMTEAHYAHLQPSFEDEQIRKSAPQLGLGSGGKVKRLRRA
jgi:integrase